MQGIHSELEIDQGGWVERAFRFFGKELRAAQIVCAFDLQAFRDDAAIPAQPETAEFHLESFGSRLADDPVLNKPREADLIQEKSQHAQNQQKRHQARAKAS